MLEMTLRSHACVVSTLGILSCFLPVFQDPTAPHPVAGVGGQSTELSVCVALLPVERQGFPL